ncbi:MAG TPA: NAD-dependent malic enzyme [Saprospiraceae bacterium]|nr:NAD-dependent malic enzyme [Saprospiraceae bacterium]
MTVQKRNVDLLKDKTQNKSTAFSREERETLGLRGLLPYVVSSQEIQLKRILGNMRRKEFDIEKYIFLSALQDRNERLFFQTVMENIEEVMPLIYTPTVGQACKEFSHIYRHAQGLYITAADKGEFEKLIDNWPKKDIKVIVVTDGQRILGLGDLGANGMGIPVGKLALYSACAGIHPYQCLPVMLDVGTDNKELRDDPFYIGYPFERVKGPEYFELVDEFVVAAQKKFPGVLIQFEDFSTPNAYTLLNKYKSKVTCFNDDIQGTAAVALAGIFASSRITGVAYKDLKVLFLGAGSASTGIADLMVSAFIEEGLTKEEAYNRLWLVDSTGLVIKGRKDMVDHKAAYAQQHEPLDFVETIKEFRPNVLIGATGAPGSFTKEIVELMCEINERPVIFALSNPTSRAECTAEQAYNWSDGKVVFASGSPFDKVTYKEKVFKSGQGNNAYIFPGIGLGVVTCKAKVVQDSLFLAAAKTLAHIVSEEDIERGSVYPPLKDIRSISLKIAVAVAEKIYSSGLALVPKPDDLEKHIADYMYDPKY